jgi:hypothetical protein
MPTTDAPLIELGRQAAAMQQYVKLGGSTSKQMLIFNICLNTVNDARRLQQTDNASLSHAIAGELEMELTRKKDNFLQEYKLLEACQQLATHFVDNIWLKVLKGHAPSQRNRRVLGSIYRMAFLESQRERVIKVKD